MAACVVMLALLQAVHVAWAAGYSPFFEEEGFAARQDFKQLQMDVSRARLNTLMVNIMDLKQRSCSAKGEYRVTLQSTLTQLLIEWRTLDPQQQPFPLPSCDEIL